jgi:hypothetical protein
MTRLPSNEIFSPSNKIQREVRRAKDLSAPRYTNELSSVNTYIDEQDMYNSYTVTEVSVSV